MARGGVSTEEAARRLVEYLCHLFPDDPGMQGEIREMFLILTTHPNADVRCTNAIDALANIVRETIATYGPTYYRRRG